MEGSKRRWLLRKQSRAMTPVTFLLMLVWSDKKAAGRTSVEVGWRLLRSFQGIKAEGQSRADRLNASTLKASIYGMMMRSFLMH